MIVRNHVQFKFFYSGANLGDAANLANFDWRKFCKGYKYKTKAVEPSDLKLGGQVKHKLRFTGRKYGIDAQGINNFLTFSWFNFLGHPAMYS